MSTLHLKDGFYKIELNKTIWEIPQRYQLLSPVGAGAYGQVRYVSSRCTCGNLYAMQYVHIITDNTPILQSAYPFLTEIKQ